jgi:hypothetical protein
MARKRMVKESASYLKTQLEYLHLQFTSLVTANVNK